MENACGPTAGFRRRGCLRGMSRLGTGAIRKNSSCHSADLVEAADKHNAVEVRPAQNQFFMAPRPADETRWLNSSLLRKSQPELCASCHGVVMAQFALPSHHRVPEGLMKCTDCH